MTADSDFDFSVEKLSSDRWVITAQSAEGDTTILAGVYFSKDAALGALFPTSARWLKSFVSTERTLAVARLA